MRKYILPFLFMMATSMTSQTFFQQKDKQLHFTAGTIAGSLGYKWSYDKHKNKKKAFIAGVCSSFAVGLVKELYDSRTGGTVEIGDVAATTLGGLTIGFTIPLFKKKK
jgi:uncharacterized protein YfiM (DUF2279 family)|tara:strand:- start:601 stop:924 length:324 start_codon:yes stop_codon:yes gene_type:complete